MDIRQKYTLETEDIDNGPNRWNYQRVRIYRREGEHRRPVGEYVRNYSAFYGTFHPFVQARREYALYSRDYTATRVMSLPDCTDLGGEERHSFGFCPVSYFVPRVPDWADAGGQFDPEGRFGFVAGCIWGDDTSWKIQYLDLSRVAEGVISREERFGYIELTGDHTTLESAIDMGYWDREDQEIRIAAALRFQLDESGKHTAT